MKILQKHKQTHDADTFVLGWYIDESLCDRLISYFENKAYLVQGKTFGGVQLDKKKSTDAWLSDQELLTEYSVHLQNVCVNYMKKYPMVDYYSPWGITEKVNLQRYYPGEGFYGWHTERGNPNCNEANRHMVFMTYLNTVDDGGETEFYHQNLKVKPEKGLTLIWPADWTYTHRGCVSNTETKYITTGWLSYIESQQEKS